MKKIWILGGGKFGSLALKQTARNFPQAEITVVDKNREPDNFPGAVVVREDGISWLVRHLNRGSDVDLIIPAVPVHVVARWLEQMADRQYKVFHAAVPQSFVAELPNVMAGGDNTVYVSHADFLCPDNCGEPEKFCTVTGKPRGEDMFRLLDRAGALVIQSHQLYLGVGGVYPEDLWALYDRILKLPSEPVLVATACRCHGVVDGLLFIPRT
ncbi:potassium transporter [Desulfomarina sp.]